MKHTLLTLATTALLLSCCKPTVTTSPSPNYTTTVTGYAVTTDSLDPIPNIVLNINPLAGSYTTPVGGKTVRTDSTGRFEFIYTGPAYGQIGIGFGGNNSYHNLGGYDYITPYTNKTHNIELQPYGWLKLHVKNVNPWNGDDRLSISLGGSIHSYYGIVDKSIHSKEPGNGTKTLVWAVEKNGIVNSFQKTIYIQGFDTSFYEILY